MLIFSKWSHCAILYSMRYSVLLLCALQGDEDARGFFFWWKLCFCVKLVLHPLGVLASWNKRPIVRPRKKREGGDSFRESMEKKDLYLCYNVVVSLKIDRIRLSKFFFMIWRTSWHVQSPDMISRDNQICLGRKKMDLKK